MTEAEEENFCYLPFVQLLLQPTGVISPCCWNQDIVLGSVPQSTLADIWNGEQIRELRREFLSGNPVKCKKHMHQIGCHRFNRGDYAKNPDLSEVQTLGPRRLDVRLNGHCNLQCIMCDVWKQPNGLYDNSDFWALGPTDIFPHLMEVDVLGGEPFVQADTYRLIHEVSAVNPNCSWAFVTNGNYNVKPILKRLDKLSIRWFMLSLDSVVPETYAKIRKGGNLERTLQTIEALAEYQHIRRDQGRRFDFSVSMCVQKDNWREIENFFTYCLVVGVRPWLQFAYDPQSVSLLSLPLSERLEILRYAEGLEKEYGPDPIGVIVRTLRDSCKERELPHELQF
ncbi:MAG: radical SAM protein [Bdellovibrionales bacterium]